MIEVSSCVCAKQATAQRPGMPEGPLICPCNLGIAVCRFQLHSFMCSAPRRFMLVRLARISHIAYADIRHVPAQTATNSNHLPARLPTVSLALDSLTDQSRPTCSTPSYPRSPPSLPLQVLGIAQDIASGLAYLHPTIVHRDLKVRTSARPDGACVAYAVAWMGHVY